MRATVPCSRPAARSASWSTRRSSRTNRSTSSYEGEGRYKFVYYLQRAGGNLGRSSRSVRHAGGRHRHDARRSRFSGKPLLSRDAAPCAWSRASSSSPRTWARRPAPSRCAAPPTSRRRTAGTRLYADLQHDRAAGGADAGRPRRDRLVHARDRVPLRASAGRRDASSHSAADRPGVLRAARRDHHARRAPTDELEAIKTALANATSRRPRRRRRRPTGDLQPPLPSPEPAAAEARGGRRRQAGRKPALSRANRRGPADP